MGAAPRIEETEDVVYYTVSEYLALDDHSAVRHEYHEGFVRAMSGGTVAHNRITGNVASTLMAHALKHNCDVFSSDMRLQVSGMHYYYPDVMVTCENLKDGQQTALKPCMVAEVLSHSTERSDLSSKLVAYITHPHLQTIVYIYQSERRVYVYQREKAGWKRQELTEGEVNIPCIQATLSLEQIYRRTAIVSKPLKVGNKHKKAT